MLLCICCPCLRHTYPCSGEWLALRKTILDPRAYLEDAAAVGRLEFMAQDVSIDDSTAIADVKAFAQFLANASSSPYMMFWVESPKNIRIKLYDSDFTDMSQAHWPFYDQVDHGWGEYNDNPNLQDGHLYFIGTKCICNAFTASMRLGDNTLVSLALSIIGFGYNPSLTVEMGRQFSSELLNRTSWIAGLPDASFFYESERIDPESNTVFREDFVMRPGEFSTTVNPCILKTGYLRVPDFNIFLKIFDYQITGQTGRVDHRKEDGSHEYITQGHGRLYMIEDSDRPDPDAYRIKSRLYAIEHGSSPEPPEPVVVVSGDYVSL